MAVIISRCCWSNIAVEESFQPAGCVDVVVVVARDRLVVCTVAGAVVEVGG